ncbi:MAG TPA: flagellar biosynthesis regulator FlaF [Paracoccaceae bacterium]|nr:flagellar biosynthesis regulator FlaF [Paracoccaceae bacterium]
MQALAQVRDNYVKSASTVKTTRGVEYEAFARVTRGLTKFLGGNHSSFAELAGFLHQNRMLWGILAADVAGDENDLPSKLRAQIFYLAEFTENHSRKVLERSETVDALVDINKSVMRGLSGVGGQKN